MSDDGTEAAGAAAELQQLLQLYDRALPQVYGYLLGRTRGDTQLAEDLAAETFLAAVEAVERRSVATVTIGWLITVARNKLVDHWRRVEREQRRQELVTATAGRPAAEAWDVPVHLDLATDVLSNLRGPYRAVLTLRYLDELSTAETAALLDRSVEATEALAVRARAAFRRAYDDRREGFDA